jgi:KDO2-lipid IV(A) lauroyltransferase
VWRRIHRRWPALRRFARRRKDALTYHLARLAIWLPRQIELEPALRLADRLGDLCYLGLPGTRRLALEHLGVAFGDQLVEREKRRIVRACLRNWARCFVEVAKMEDIRARFDEYVELSGWEHLESVRGQAAIVVTGHVGNWELMAAYAARAGIPVTALARRLNDPRLNQMLVDFRSANAVQSILRESPTASREIVSFFRHGGVLAFLIDQDIQTPSVSVPFFGRMARTPVAAALFAVRRNLPVVPAFAQRRPEGGHRFIFLPVVYPPAGGDRRHAIVELTRQFNQLLEAHIRANPTEWVWWHRRWRRPPDPDLDLDAEIG